MPQTVAAIGTVAEIGHHVQSLAAMRPVVCLAPDEAASKLEPGDLAIFYSEHFERFRRCNDELRKRGIATLYLVDGILEWRNAWENRPEEPACPWTMRPVLADKVACMGASQARVLAAWGNRQKVEIVGVPRFDSLKNMTLPEPVVGKFRILVATAKSPGFTPEQVRITLESLRDLKDSVANIALADGRQMEVVWRVSPGLAEQLEVANSLNDLTGIELVQQLQQVDAVITTPSTTMIESMLLKRPVALLDFHNCPQYVPAAWTIRTSGQIETVLAELAAPSRAKLELQEQILADALQTGESARDRLNQLVDSMLLVASDAIMGGVPPEYPADMLPPPKAFESHINLSALYPHFGEFENPDAAMLQAELAHSRREILHLEAVISGLRQELGQAHEIFDQIHRHPLAGPVVRARQKILDMIGKLRPPPKATIAAGIAKSGGDPCSKR